MFCPSQLCLVQGVRIRLVDDHQSCASCPMDDRLLEETTSDQSAWINLAQPKQNGTTRHHATREWHQTLHPICTKQEELVFWSSRGHLDWITLFQALKCWTGKKNNCGQQRILFSELSLVWIVRILSWRPWRPYIGGHFGELTIVMTDYHWVDRLLRWEAACRGRWAVNPVCNYFSLLGGAALVIRGPMNNDVICKHGMYTICLSWCWVKPDNTENSATVLFIYPSSLLLSWSPWT